MSATMNIIMAVSKDGYVARGPTDDMSWLGGEDKAVFRILTGVGGMVAVSRKTANLMPKHLEGRTLLALSSREEADGDLEDFSRRHNVRWLAGGQTLALVALRRALVGEVHICRSDRSAFPRHPDMAIPDLLTPYMQRGPMWNRAMRTRLFDVTVECWRY